MPKSPTGILKDCLECKNSYYVKKYQIPFSKFCSRKCKDKNASIQIITNCFICKKQFSHISARCSKAKYCSNKCRYKAQINNGRTEYTCHHCNKKFMDSKSHKRKFCSQKCVNKSHHKIWKAKFTTVRKSMLCRGMIEKCQLCGFNTCKNILGVHHIDENRHNNELSNLMVLCPNCHSMQHQKHITHGAPNH